MSKGSDEASARVKIELHAPPFRGRGQASPARSSLTVTALRARQDLIEKKASMTNWTAEMAE